MNNIEQEYIKQYYFVCRWCSEKGKLNLSFTTVPHLKDCPIKRIEELEKSLENSHKTNDSLTKKVLEFELNKPGGKLCTNQFPYYDYHECI